MKEEAKKTCKKRGRSLDIKRIFTKRWDKKSTERLRKEF